jgi:hypothetical protein
MSQNKKKVDNKSQMNLSEAYLADYSKVIVTITEEHYANLSWISIGQRDAFIDFFKAPGIIEDGVPVLNGIRIYLPIVAALKLAEEQVRSYSTQPVAGLTAICIS